MTPPEAARADTIQDSLATTIASGPAASTVDVEAAWLDVAALPDRYVDGQSLGEGGMGEVRLSRDRRVGRDVAMKVIRPGHGSTGGFKSRFLREARVQGQLEHPAIVPVYDMGVNENGQAYFTMKRVHGKTLEEILDAVRAGDQDVSQKYSRRKLLAAFQNVCLAIEFAHRRGVVHRDLKPGNIMLGDFGEVYLLDWGIAKLVGTADAPEEHAPVETGDSTRTLGGEMMGTPGFMSPEQVRGDVDAIDRRSDVYALGAILFELLTLEPLFERAPVPAMLATALRPVEARPSVRVPDAGVPPELEAVCVKATALDPADRHAAVREIADAIERYLDGDRDLERRRALSREQSEAAERALATADEDVAARRTAMQAVGRALALDPSNADAVRSLVKLVTEPPKVLPPEARVALESARGRAHQRGARNAGFAYMSWFLYAPFVLWMGIRNWTAGLIVGALWLVASLAAIAASRRRIHSGSVPWITIALSFIAVVGASAFFGPFVLLPSIAAVNALSFVVAADRPRRIVATVLGAASIVLPFVLELVGVFPPSYRFEHGTMVILPHIVSFQRVPTLAFLLFANIAVVVSACAFLIRFGADIDRAEERLHTQAWQLRQLVPEEARVALPAVPTDDASDLVCAAGFAGPWAWTHRRVRVTSSSGC